MHHSDFFWPTKMAACFLFYLLALLNQPCTLQQEFKWRELEEQRKAERLHKRLQQEQAYLLSLQHESKQQPGDKTKVPSDQSKPPKTSTLPPDRTRTSSPHAQVVDSAVSESTKASQVAPAESSKSQAAAQEKTDETSLISHSPSPSSPPSPSVTEAPTDSEPPQAESSEPDRPPEPVSLLPQPIREVNRLLSLSALLPALLSFLLLAFTQSVSSE